MNEGVTALWPLAGLSLVAPSLTMQYPDDGLLARLARVAAGGIHDPEVMPFLEPWTDTPPPALERGLMQGHWRARAEWRPERWDLRMAVVVDGGVVGMQRLVAEAYPVTREVTTHSWLGQAYQRRGIGTAMRAATLTFAFEALGAEYAVTAAFDDNVASRRVTERMGYSDDGVFRASVRGRLVTGRRYRLHHSAFTRRVQLRIEGFDACRPLFGCE